MQPGDPHALLDELALGKPAKVTAARNAASVAKVPGSVGLTEKSIDCRKRVRTSEPSNPAAMPKAIVTAPSASASLRMSSGICRLPTYSSIGGWHVPARRWRGLTDGVARCGSAAGGCDSDGVGTAIFLLALPAGALGDIFDRRKLIIVTEIGMVSVAAIAALTLLH